MNSKQLVYKNYKKSSLRKTESPAQKLQREYAWNLAKLRAATATMNKLYSQLNLTLTSDAWESVTNMLEEALKTKYKRDLAKLREVEGA